MIASEAHVNECQIKHKMPNIGCGDWRIDIG